MLILCAGVDNNTRMNRLAWWGVEYIPAGASCNARDEVSRRFFFPHKSTVMVQHDISGREV